MTSIDVTGWAPAGPEFLGTKPKQWLRSPIGDRWLWKASMTQMDAVHGPFRKGDDWAEVVAAGIGAELGVSVAEVTLATRGDGFGVVSRSVVHEDIEVLVHGNELLADLGISPSDDHDRTGYTVQAVATVLAGVDPPSPSAFLSTAFDAFAGYLILDAVVGNTDRHQDNWAMIGGPTGWRLAPSFDHASCLGFQLSDAERTDRLAGLGNRSIETYARLARSKFEGRPGLIAAAIAALGLATAQAREHWCRVIDHGLEWSSVTERIPESRMSAVAREFATALLVRNHTKLSQAIRTMWP